MNGFNQGLLSLLGRAAIAGIFLMSALGNKIPNFSTIVDAMRGAGVPLPNFALVGAIGFLIAGGFSVLLGYKVRIGATLLLVFLALATFYFHPFWRVALDQKDAQMAHFMKNVALMGTMVFLIANGPGAWSLDRGR